MSEHQHNKEKRLLERAAVQIFIRLYNDQHVRKLRLLYQQERPDAVLEDDQRQKTGLEITHLFYDATEAKMLLGRSEEQFQGTGKLEDLIAELNALIQRKESKKSEYSKDYPISLLIRNASPHFGLTHFMNSMEQIYVPKGIFKQIWFLTRDGSSEWFLMPLDRNERNVMGAE